MGVQVRSGSVLDADTQTLINTVNCVGVMGKGIALEFKKRYPVMYEDYRRRCASPYDRRRVRLGRPYCWKPPRKLRESPDPPPWIINFPTKGHWRAGSRWTDIEAGLVFLRRSYKRWGVRSLAVPPLGCGNGGLRWTEVGPRLYQHFLRYEIPVVLYVPPDTAPEHIAYEFLIGGGKGADGRTVQTLLPESRASYSGYESS